MGQELRGFVAVILGLLDGVLFPLRSTKPAPAHQLIGRLDYRHPLLPARDTRSPARTLIPAPTAMITANARNARKERARKTRSSKNAAPATMPATMRPRVDFNDMADSSGYSRQASMSPAAAVARTIRVVEPRQRRRYHHCGV